MPVRAKRSRKSATRSRPTTPRTRGSRRWSARVTRTSNALDLEAGVFKLQSPRRIAASLKRSAERSRRRKARPYASAMSMLTFYINRAGTSLSARQKSELQKAKAELRKLFGRDERPDRPRTPRTR